jgi:hypothetical protein
LESEGGSVFSADATADDNDIAQKWNSSSNESSAERSRHQLHPPVQHQNRSEIIANTFSAVERLDCDESIILKKLIASAACVLYKALTSRGRNPSYMTECNWFIIIAIYLGW